MEEERDRLNDDLFVSIFGQEKSKIAEKEQNKDFRGEQFNPFCLSLSNHIRKWGLLVVWRAGDHNRSIYELTPTQPDNWFAPFLFRQHEDDFAQEFNGG